MKRRYIQFYNKDLTECIGSFGYQHYNNRRSNLWAIRETVDKIKKQQEAYNRDPKKYIKPDTIFRIVYGDQSSSTPLTSYITLNKAGLIIYFKDLIELNFKLLRDEKD